VNRTTYPPVEATPGQTWRAQANCLGMDVELFFPEPPPKGRRIELDPFVIEVCNSCPVRRQCQDEARRTHSQGVWGGRTERDRAKRPHPTEAHPRAHEMAVRGYGQHRDLDAIVQRLNDEGLPPPNARAKRWTVMDVIAVLRSNGAGA
jgi:Transcription factor WhiB